MQTSNSLYITQPSLETHDNEIPIPVTRAIASCTATLELHTSEVSAATLLREVLPVFDIIAGDVDATDNGKSRAAIFEHVPLSDGQCAAGWKEVIAFEHENSSFQPSWSAQSHVWKSVHAAALAEGIKLDKQFLMDDISRAASEDGYPSGLAVAILQHLSTDDQDPAGPWSCLDRTKTIAFVGKLLLNTKSNNDYLIAEFTDAWQDQMPEAWRLHTKLEAIEGHYQFPTDATIRASDQGSATTDIDTTSASAPKPAARKWHEKFGKTRKK